MNKTFRKLGGVVLCLAALSMTSCDVIGIPDNASAKFIVKLNTEDLLLAPGEWAVRASSNATAATTYTSSDATIATVDATGRVTAVAEGECVITVATPYLATKTIEGDEILSTATASFRVIVKKKAGTISFAETAISKQPTDDAFTNALTKVGDGTVSYASSKTDVATVNASTGEVTIVGPGETTITATVTDGAVYSYATKTATYTVTVAKKAGSISYATTAVNKTVGDAAFTNTLTKTGDGTVSYASSNTAVATINSTTGQVTIVGPGETTITATVTDGAVYSYATKTASYTLTVGALGVGANSSFGAGSDPLANN